LEIGAGRIVVDAGMELDEVAGVLRGENKLRDGGVLAPHSVEIAQPELEAEGVLVIVLPGEIVGRAEQRVLRDQSIGRGGRIYAEAACQASPNPKSETRHRPALASPYPNRHRRVIARLGIKQC